MQFSVDEGTPPELTGRILNVVVEEVSRQAMLMPYLKPPIGIRVKKRTGGLNVLMNLDADKSTGFITLTISDDGFRAWRSVGEGKGHWRSFHFNCSHVVTFVTRDGREWASGLPAEL